MFFQIRKVVTSLSGRNFSLWFLGVILFCMLGVGIASGHSAYSKNTPQLAATIPTLPSDIQSATVVYLGETHDQPSDHEAQLDLIQQLQSKNPNVAIAMEMFQQPYQEWLDQYLAGTLSEAELRDRTEFDARWGYAWESYAPILRVAQASHIPVLALNMPTEATRHVAQYGLEGLDPELAQWIPPADELELGPRTYREHLRAVYDEIHRGSSYSLNFDNFFLAQILWDETMAEAIANYVRAHPQDQLIVLVGQGHITYGYGIPRRVARRLAHLDDFTQRSLLLNPTDEQRAVGAGVIADNFWPLSQDASSQ